MQFFLRVGGGDYIRPIWICGRIIEGQTLGGTKGTHETQKSLKLRGGRHTSNLHAYFPPGKRSPTQLGPSGKPVFTAHQHARIREPTALCATR